MLNIYCETAAELLASEKRFSTYPEEFPFFVPQITRIFCFIHPILFFFVVLRRFLHYLYDKWPTSFSTVLWWHLMPRDKTVKLIIQKAVIEPVLFWREHSKSNCFILFHSSRPRMGSWGIYWLPVSLVTVSACTGVSLKHTRFLALVSHMENQHPHCPANLSFNFSAFYWPLKFSVV